MENQGKQPTRVFWQGEYLINMGNFENLKLICGVQTDALEGETAKAASARVFSLVESELMDKIQEIKETL